MNKNLAEALLCVSLAITQWVLLYLSLTSKC